jgi:mercuric ion binding protein
MTGFVFTPMAPAKPTEQIQNNRQSVTLDMQNMTCAMCKFTIKKALQGVEGVKTVEVDADKKTASVTFNGQKTTIEALIKATTEAGYPATIHPEK